MRLSITKIVREVPEPERSRVLKELHQNAEAVVLEYKPDARAPAWRNKAITVHHGIPERTTVFHAGKPKVVGLALAIVILRKFQEVPGQTPELAWYDGEWVEHNEPFEVKEKLTQVREDFEEESKAISPVGDDEGDDGFVGEDSGDDDLANLELSDTDLEAGKGATEDNGQAPKKYVSQMNRDELRNHYSELTGQDWDEEWTKAQLRERIEAHNTDGDEGDDGTE